MQHSLIMAADRSAANGDPDLLHAAPHPLGFAPGQCHREPSEAEHNVTCFPVGD